MFLLFLVDKPRFLTNRFLIKLTICIHINIGRIISTNTISMLVIDSMVIIDKKLFLTPFKNKQLTQWPKIKYNIWIRHFIEATKVSSSSDVCIVFIRVNNIQCTPVHYIIICTYSFHHLQQREVSVTLHVWRQFVDINLGSAVGPKVLYLHGQQTFKDELECNRLWEKRKIYEAKASTRDDVIKNKNNNKTIIIIFLTEKQLLQIIYTYKYQ